MLWLVVVRLRSAILHPSLILPGVTVRTSPIIPLPLPVTPPPPPPSPLLALSAVRPTRYDRIASTDVNGYDLRFEGATLQCGLGFNRECPIEQLKAACDELSACAGFSTFGYLKLDVSKPLRKFSGDSSLYVRNVLNPLLEQPPAAAIAPLRAKVAAASPGVNPLDLVLINGVCPADSTMTRVGGAFGDGGKWICVSKSTRTAATAARCIVYSVGSNLDFSFEEALRVLLPNCNFYTFDCTVDRQVAMERKPIWLNFMHWCLVAEADISIQDRDRGLRGAVRGAHGEDVEKLGGQSFTWREFTKRLGHTNEEITLLKFDIEGWEWHLFDDLLKPNIQAGVSLIEGIKQLSFELHLDGNTPFPPGLSIGREEVIDLYAALYSKGFRCVKTEPNNVDCAEFTWFKETPSDQVHK